MNSTTPRLTLRPFWTARSPRIVPGSAASGSVAPMSFRPDATTPSPSQTMHTTGPDTM
jgi:hypothetical protein